jgi:hypothetical protein
VEEREKEVKERAGVRVGTPENYVECWPHVMLLGGGQGLTLKNNNNQLQWMQGSREEEDWSQLPTSLSCQWQ